MPTPTVGQTVTWVSSPTAPDPELTRLSGVAMVVAGGYVLVAGAAFVHDPATKYHSARSVPVADILTAT